MYQKGHTGRHVLKDSAVKGPSLGGSCAIRSHDGVRGCDKIYELIPKEHIVSARVTCIDRG